MELLLLLPLLLVGGLAFGGGGGDDDAPGTETEPGTETPAPSDEAGQVQVGTNGPEELAGTVLNDILLGGAGRDTIEGLGGNDVIAGEVGNDVLTGDAGTDVVLGGAGNDRVDGATGQDLLIGGAGNDTLTGGPGNDLLIGSSGSDLLRGDEGNDTLIGVEFDRIAPDLASSAAQLRTELSGGFGNAVTDEQLDRVTNAVRSGSAAERGPDQLQGDAGNDLLLGDDGDTLSGGIGDDDFGIAYRPGEALTTLTDFDHRTETLTLILDNPASAQIVLRANGPEMTLIEVDGQPVARLLGQDVSLLEPTRASWLLVERA